MCFQNYAHCLCQHTLLLEEPCELANSHPFYLKVACPDYQIISQDYRQLCGSGKFYCKEDKEGQFFEHVYELFQQETAELKQTMSQIAWVNAQATEFTRLADVKGVSLEVRQNHSAYKAITNRFRELAEQKVKVTEQCQVVQAVLKQGVKLYQARAAQTAKGVGDDYLPMTLPGSLRYKLPPELRAQFDGITGSGTVNSTTTSEAIDVSGSRKSRGGLSYLHDSKEGKPPFTPQLLPPLEHGSRFTPNASELIELLGATNDDNSLKLPKPDTVLKRSIEQNPTEDSQDSLAKQSRTIKKPNLANESSTVRRSARVRDKKVNYAESEASTTHSRETSPYKSDVDNVSPPKSDRSFSPSPRHKMLRHRPKMGDLKKENMVPNSKLSRNNSSLSGLVAEWRRGASSIHAFASPMEPTLTDSTNERLHVGPQVNIWPPMTGGTPSNGLPTLQAIQANTGDVTPQYQPVHATQKAPIASKSSIQGAQENVPWSTAEWQHLFSNTNYMPSTPGLVPVPSYQHNMDIIQPMQNHATSSFQTGGMFCTPPAQSDVMQGDTTTTFPSQPFANFITDAVTPRFQREQGGHTNGTDGNHQRSRHGKFVTPSPVNFNYDQLRRSFSATKELTPPTNVDAKSIDTDPKKRRLSASSPLPSSKRMRLSLPGDDLSSVCEQDLPYTVATSMSSPPKAMSRFLSANKENNTPWITSTEHAEPVTPAPTLAPTALMYRPNQRAVVSHTTAKPAMTNSVAEPSGDEDVADGVDNASSDIDWGLVNEELF